MRTDHALWLPGAENLRRRDAASATRATVDGAAATARSSAVFRGIAACGAILALGVASVLAPMLSPAAQEAEALRRAQEIQVLANLWRLENHPRDDALYFHPAFPPPSRHVERIDTGSPALAAL